MDPAITILLVFCFADLTFINIAMFRLWRAEEERDKTILHILENTITLIRWVEQIQKERIAERKNPWADLTRIALGRS